MTQSEATTISTKARKLLPGDVVFSTTGDLLAVEVAVDEEWGGVWVTWHNERRESFPLDYTVYRVVEA